MEKDRKTAGGITLNDLMSALEREEPSLFETQRRLSGGMVTHGDGEAKKPKFKRLKNPVFTMDTFYVLPSKLLEPCLKLLL